MIQRTALLLAVIAACAVSPAQREYSGIYPEHVVENTRTNAVNDPWGQQVRRNAELAAAHWAALTDDQLWTLIPNQALPRCIDVTWDYDYPSNPRLGCLNCGDAIHEYGFYPYEPNIWSRPWKLTCPNCKVVFPTNDFGAYYRSGINSQGLFDPAIADRSLLFNSAHPDPSDPLHKYGVDDGNGYVDANGREHKFIGYYTWKFWRELYEGVNALSNAYLLTGDKMYARKAAIMLDRIADVYPGMDWAPYANRGWYHSDGGSKRGKIEGRIWETATVQHFARAYDRIISGTVDNPELYTFLAAKDRQFTLPGDKGTRAALIANIDSGILQTAANAIISQQIRGNEGMHQLSMAYCALSLNSEPETTEWLNWLFDERGGHIPTMLVQLFDRDGMANEAAPHYNYLWPGKIHEIMRLLENYPSFTDYRISRDFPWFVNASLAPWRAQALNTFTPNIGDSWATGLINLGVNAHMVAAGYEFFGNETAARYAWEANGRRANNLLMDIGNPTPDYLNRQLEQAALNYPAELRHGENMAGYGLASFEFGENSTGKALWLYYGRNMGHGHQDRLNFGIYAFGTDLSPDMGYPEYANSTWKPRAAWNNNTISHNTVVVDKAVQKTNWTGYPRFYTAQPGFGAVEVESTNVYPQCSEYARTMAFIQAPQGNAFAVDLFRVAGGSDHLLSFHGPPGAVTNSGLSLTPQPTGTYAGSNVPYGDNSTAYPFGYSYLKNVERDTDPPQLFTLDWKAEEGYRGVTSSDNIHLRMHVLTQLDDIALADGVPAQNQPGNPDALRYALLHRAGAGIESLQTQFVSILEPWKNQPFISSVARLPVTGVAAADAIALRIGHSAGITDYIVSNPQKKMIQVTGGPVTDGAFAWMRVQDGRVTSASLTQGTVLSYGSRTIGGTGNIAGQVVGFTKDIKAQAVAWLLVSKGDPTKMVGSQLIVQNDRVRNACYDILKVEEANTVWKVTCGPASFVRGFVDTADYSKGYVYNIAEGNPFYVPVTTSYSEAPAEVGGWELY